MEGWLEKRGGKYSGWKKRYFVLQSSLLFYFTSEVKVCAESYRPLENGNGAAEENVKRVCAACDRDNAASLELASSTQSGHPC